MFFDLNIKGSSLENNIKLAIQASDYGWEHINFSYNQNEFKEALKLRDNLKDSLDDIIDFDYTLEIKSTNINEIRKHANNFRSRASCISVVGGDLKVNRAVLENIKIDVLSRPYLNRFDSGMNHVLAKEAVRNNVAIEICFKDILRTYLAPRAKVISNFRDLYLLYRKFDFPLILSSRAESVFDIKTVHDFINVFTQTGLTADEIDKSFKTSEEILKFNENRQDLILKGVRRVDDEA
ncbi:MAG: ribonuclease P [Methanobrevibacter sp.]|uniref:ribonuclease P protein component 3 n=1 Tax=Methanobrevibacter sp. TaxID=66852 RepID=UPI001B474A3B|nr:RNase P subunit p30 family protein [Methanobrevibacter sp.]MBP3226607.1 ribonuclease P [Methanobrevibacter sp.]MBP3791926.1 ribonuclease P [Methanobrevibacter sp.]